MRTHHILKFSAIALLLATGALGFTACDKQLDIIPKGETTLDNIDDIALLLNQEYSMAVYPFTDLGIICNESLGPALSIPEVLSSNNTLNYAYIAYDESVDRTTLCQNDDRYNAIYRYVNYMNTILTKIDDVEGSAARKTELKAQARIMRAYLHWLCVNIHATQYDAASAEKAGGIAYVTDIDNLKVKEKLSLAKTYEAILDDCTDDVIEALPSENTDVITPNRAFGYAVRAKVLLQMKRYDEAAPYFEKALAINDAIEDRSGCMASGEWQLQRTVKDNYLWIGSGFAVSPTMEVLSLESCAKFEKNDYVIKYVGDSGWSLSYGRMLSGLEGTRMFMGWNTCTNPYGITSDHIYYDLAECKIRTGQIKDGLALMDKVRKNRIQNASSYVTMYQLFPFDTKAAMKLLREAKWIECLGGYENFFDTKRWNSEEEYKADITRDLKDYGSFTIKPDSPLWVLPFPGNATRNNPTLTQNY